MSDSTTIEVPFREFASISRLSRDMIVTEKLDGTNAQVTVTEDGRVLAGSRNRWITPDADNFGFAAWVRDHEDELRGMGPGSHYGEWWGAGIQRRYGLTEKRFSLFNVGRWTSDQSITGRRGESTQCAEVRCCHVVPVLLRWTFDTGRVDAALSDLAEGGSWAAPGFMKPEGVVVFHAKSGTLFKKTLDKNDGHKGGHSRMSAHTADPRSIAQREALDALTADGQAQGEYDALPLAIEHAIWAHGDAMYGYVKHGEPVMNVAEKERALRTAITTALREARRSALEEAAKAADAHAAQCVADYDGDDYYAGRQYAAEDIASAIRALATPERDTSDA